MIKILLVDDEKGITDALQSFFKHRGFATESVNNGEDAVKSVKKDKPDIVFLDIRMKSRGESSFPVLWLYKPDLWA